MRYFIFISTMFSLFSLVACSDAPKSEGVKTVSKENLPTTNLTVAPIPNASNVAPSTDVYSLAAEATCECLTPLITKVKQMVDLQKQGKSAEIEKLGTEISAMESQIQTCSENIRKKYGDMKTEEDQKRIFFALKDRCPDVVTYGGALKEK